MLSPAEVSRDRGPENSTVPPTPPGRGRYRLSHFHRTVVRDLEDGAAWSESNSTIARRNSICQIVNVLVVVPIWYPWFILTVFAAAIVAGRLSVGVRTHDDHARSRDRHVTTLTVCGYIVGSIALFVCCGVAKGAVCKLVPSVFEEHGRALALDGSERHHWVRVMSVAFPDAAGDTRMLATESTIRETR